MVIKPVQAGAYHSFEFAVADRRLVLRFDDNRVSCDLDGAVPAERPKQRTQPVVKLLGSGTLELRHLGVYRDMYYLDEQYGNMILRATLDNPLTLEKDEFFCCGDNSPNSYDSRLWRVDGIGNEGKTYRQGIVPPEL